MKRLLAETVASNEHSLRDCVPDGERKHAIEVFDARLAPLLIGCKNNFRVGSGLERVLQCRELLAQLFEVVNLAIEDDPKLAIVADHWLMAGFREIQNGETTE